MSIPQTKADKEGEDPDHQIATTNYSLVLFEQVSGEEWVGRKKKVTCKMKCKLGLTSHSRVYDHGFSKSHSKEHT
jgi:hypothetical protein